MTAELEALERWARGRGILLMGRWVNANAAWMVTTKALGDQPWPHGGDTVWYFGDSDQREAKAWDIDPLTALLWANAVEATISDALALLVCEAAPRRWSGVQAITGNTEVDRMTAAAIAKGIMVPGDDKAREALTVAADRLLAEGVPLGEWIAAWLRGECTVPGCQESAELIGAAGWASCPSCHGHGVMLAAHVDAMIAGLFAV